MVPVPEHSDVEVTVPEEIESRTGKLIWLWLATNGGGTSKDVSQGIDEPQSKVISILSVLKNQGTVESERAGGRPVFDVRNT